MSAAPPSRQAGGAYLCFALAPQGWLPPVLAGTAEEAWMWAVNPLRAPFDELRITDMTEDECLIHVLGDELKFPTHVECQMPEQDWRKFWHDLSASRREARLRSAKALRPRLPHRLARLPLRLGLPPRPRAHTPLPHVGGDGGRARQPER
jgi:hypothetical protein